jgi:hypothetical protein
MYKTVGRSRGFHGRLLTKVEVVRRYAPQLPSMPHERLEAIK